MPLVYMHKETGELVVSDGNYWTDNDIHEYSIDIAMEFVLGCFFKCLGKL